MSDYESAGELKSQALSRSGQTFVLASGIKANFFMQHIDARELADKTFVSMANNGRDQNALTEESLSDITRTLTSQQFFPAIGCLRENGKIELLDGSRRRAAAILVGVGLDVMVTEDSIDFQDARSLAQDIQTAREHNLRELGLRLLTLKNGGMNQQEIAESQRLSTAKVTRAIQAASVPAEMLSVFPDQSALTYPDYKCLLEIATSIAFRGFDKNSLIESVKLEFESLPSSLSTESMNRLLIKSYKKHAADIAALPLKTHERGKTEKLWTFSDKDTFARRKVKGRTISYEFGRLPKAMIQNLDEAIVEILNKHLNR